MIQTATAAALQRDNRPHRAESSIYSPSTIEGLNDRMLRRAFIGGKVGSLDYINERVRRTLMMMGIERKYIPFTTIEEAANFLASVPSAFKSI